MQILNGRLIFGEFEKETLVALWKQARQLIGGWQGISSNGLGLYLAKQFVDAHHGKIWVESEGEGKGSTFLVELAVE